MKKNVEWFLVENEIHIQTTKIIILLNNFLSYLLFKVSLNPNLATTTQKQKQYFEILVMSARTT